MYLSSIKALGATYKDVSKDKREVKIHKFECGGCMNCKECQIDGVEYILPSVLVLFTDVITDELNLEEDFADVADYFRYDKLEFIGEDSFVLKLAPPEYVGKRRNEFKPVNRKIKKFVNIIPNEFVDPRYNIMTGKGLDNAKYWSDSQKSMKKHFPLTFDLVKRANNMKSNTKFSFLLGTHKELKYASAFQFIHTYLSDGIFQYVFEFMFNHIANFIKNVFNIDESDPYFVLISRFPATQVELCIVARAYVHIVRREIFGDKKFALE